MYRAMALYLIRQGVDASSRDAIIKSCDGADISIEYRNGEQIVLLNGENVNAYLRTEEVSNMASVSSAIAEVRAKLLSLQRDLAKKQSVVMDGRDIGTTILPDAQVKIYLTASSLTRAKRRFLELSEKGETLSLEEIQKDIEERDERDMNRKVSPLKQAEDAVYVDSSDMKIEEVVDTILRITKEKTGE